MQYLCGAIARALLAHNLKLVATANDLNAKGLFDLRKVAVELATKIDQQSVIREFKTGCYDVFGGWRWCQRADAQAGLR
jgi:hypothetical protein